MLTALEKPEMLNMHAFLLNRRDLYLFLSRNLGMDVASNLVILAMCRSRLHPNPPDYYAYPYPSSLDLYLERCFSVNRSHSVEEVTGTLQMSLDVVIP